MNRLYTAASLTLALLLGGCLNVNDPISISIDFTPLYTRNDDGTCAVRYEAAASGLGAATWERVTISQGGQVLEEFPTARIADFWGANRIEAGQAQISTPITIPTAATDALFTFRYRTFGPERTAELRPNCAPTS